MRHAVRRHVMSAVTKYPLLFGKNRHNMSIITKCPPLKKEIVTFCPPSLNVRHFFRNHHVMSAFSKVQYIPQKVITVCPTPLNFGEIVFHVSICTSLNVSWGFFFRKMYGLLSVNNVEHTTLSFFSSKYHVSYPLV